MCGIFGFVACRERDASDVLDGLRYLEYRGYDSWGIAVASGGEILTEKAVGAIAGARTSLPMSTLALGHTRWATHGGVTRANAHPHVDCSGRFALIHNGIVENYHELSASLTRHHTFHSQTDTEVLVHLLEEALEHERDLLRALLQVFRLVQGLSAVAVLDARSGEVVVAKNGSPLALGWAEGTSYLASDPIALLDYTRSVTFLEDGQAARLSQRGIDLVDVGTGDRIDPVVRTVSWDTRKAGLEGHAHFMDKEIHEQPSVLRGIADKTPGSAADLCEAIRAARDVYLIGCGTAYHAALSARYMLAEIGHRQCAAVMASEADLILPGLGSQSLVIAFSQSGETIDVLQAVRSARGKGAVIAAIVNAEGSALHRFADLSILLGCGPERCVLATKSYLGMLAVIQVVARALQGHVERAALELEETAGRLEALFAREVADGKIVEVARRITDHQHMFVLGRHRNYPQALEAALKIKEVSYMHAEGFAAGELKHGVIALVTHGTPVLVLAPDDDYRREALTAAAEVRARGAYVVGMSPTEEQEFDLTLPVSRTSANVYESAVLAQMLAYQLALLRGCDPDKPRNLAKSVTVK